MQINVVFGSKSDSRVYELLRDLLIRIPGVDIKLELCSAQHEPDRLSQFIKENPCDLFIAGAGGAAHLPGVVASQIKAPVIGVPLNGVLHGWDALLSIVQMPEGVPVLSSGVENVEAVARFVEFFAAHQQKPPALRIVAPKWATNFVDDLANPLSTAGWEISRENYASIAEKIGDRKALHIVFADLNSPLPFGSAANVLTEASVPFLAVPLSAEKPYMGELNVLFDFIAKGGLWVGVNTVQNMLLSLLKFWPQGAKEAALLEELTGGVKQGAR